MPAPLALLPRSLADACRRRLCCVTLLAIATCLSHRATAQQIESAGEGLRQWSSGRLTLVTDLPIDDELKQWPEMLEQAIAQFSRVWNVPLEKTESLKLTAYLMADRRPFQDAGLLAEVPPFDDGFQWNDRIFIVDQPSAYYRRHLFLHETTHWIMYRFLGGAGSPWFMEGMADMFGTHLWRDRSLLLNRLPSYANEVPHWGRFKRLHEMLNDETAPSLPQILVFGNSRNDRSDRYVWSWAATVFFWNHPEYQRDLAEASQPPLDYSMQVSTRLSQRLQARWPLVVADWNGFLSDFDFGFDPTQSMVRLNRDQDPRVPATTLTEPMTLELESHRGWQDSGILLEPEDRIEIHANGSYILSKRDPTNPWDCGPQGITYRYFQHQPLGKVIAAIVSPVADQPSRRWQIIPIGNHTVITAKQAGHLLFKINEPAGDLADNQGSLSLSVQVPKP